MRQRSFDSVVRRKVLLALAPLAGLAAASVVALALSESGYAVIGATLSLGASWVAIVYRREIFHRSDRAKDYVTGLGSERIVREQLARLANRCFVKHDIGLPSGGNIDHVVCGPTGAFAIETKTNGYPSRALSVARRRAKWLSTKLDDHWVTPVICLVNREQAPFEHDRVWVMGLAELLPWLEHRRGRPVDPVFALRALGD
jgi:hypothetical protein